MFLIKENSVDKYLFKSYDYRKKIIKFLLNDELENLVSFMKYFYFSDKAKLNRNQCYIRENIIKIEKGEIEESMDIMIKIKTS